MQQYWGLTDSCKCYILTYVSSGQIEWCDINPADMNMSTVLGKKVLVGGTLMAFEQTKKLVGFLL